LSGCEPACITRIVRMLRARPYPGRARSTKGNLKSSREPKSASLDKPERAELNPFCAGLGPGRQSTRRLAEYVVHCLTKYRQDCNRSQSHEHQQESILD